MSWRKYFTPVAVGKEPGSYSPVGSSNGQSSRPGPARANYSSFLPEVYTGAPNRIERYLQYSTMDMDSEIAAALDILAEFCTQKNKENKTPFYLSFRNKATNSEISILREYLQQWSKLQQFETRMFRIIRNVFKNGDCFFVRDPETQKWQYIDPAKLVKIIVNESEGKLPEQYVIRDLSPNFQNLVVTAINPGTTNTNNRGTSYVAGGAAARGMIGAYPANPSSSGSRFTMGQDEVAVESRHVVHLSLSEGLDNNYPFGNSILENIFKVYKQKELLEDAILIYRIVRAPERRVFYIDVGNMPSHLAMSFVERVKNEINQRRIPSPIGGAGSYAIDSSFNPMCLDLSTNIPLLDGRTLSLSAIIEEYKNGKENWVYSCNPETGAVVPGNITWAGITRENADTIKITLDNGKELVCTPDHKIPVFGKGFVEAKDLTVDDSLIAFNIRNKKIQDNKKSNDYQQVWDHACKKWVYTHRMVGHFFKAMSAEEEFTYLPQYANSVKQVIHHKDCNRFNNDPANLCFMTKQDHILYHSSNKTQYWENMSDEEYDRITTKISNTTKDNWNKKTEEEKNIARDKFKLIRQRGTYARVHDPIVRARYAEKMSKKRKEYFEQNPAALAQARKNVGKRVSWSNQSLVVTFEMLQIIANIVKTQSTEKKTVIKLCDQNEALLKLVKDANSVMPTGATQCKIDFTKFGESKMKRLLRHFGYKKWATFVTEIDNFNHRIIKIEKHTNMTVGTITVDGQEQWHDYHTFAISSGIYVKNSTNEDFYFPTTSDGKGSKVDTLNGGSNVGEIADLQFFTNKLFRGLRIPSSYLPTGAEDSGQQYNDGRVGTAYIQELRFNNYCMRLQSLVEGVFDEEFKLYLYNRGVNIDSSLFEIKLQDPQNFASYRQAEMDNQRAPTFAQMVAIPTISKRFALKRFLGLSDEELAENERMWAEENGESTSVDTDSVSEMRGIGISQAGIQSDASMAQTPELPADGAGAMAGATPDASTQPMAGAESQG